MLSLMKLSLFLVGISIAASSNAADDGETQTELRSMRSLKSSNAAKKGKSCKSGFAKYGVYETSLFFGMEAYVWASRGESATFSLDASRNTQKYREWAFNYFKIRYGFTFNTSVTGTQYIYDTNGTAVAQMTPSKAANFAQLYAIDAQHIPEWRSKLPITNVEVRDDGFTISVLKSFSITGGSIEPTTLPAGVTIFAGELRLIDDKGRLLDTMQATTDYPNEIYVAHGAVYGQFPTRIINQLTLVSERFGVGSSQALGVISPVSFDGDYKLDLRYYARFPGQLTESRVANPDCDNDLDPVPVPAQRKCTNTSMIGPFSKCDVEVAFGLKPNSLIIPGDSRYNKIADNNFWTKYLGLPMVAGRLTYVHLNRRNRFLSVTTLGKTIESFARDYFIEIPFGGCYYTPKDSSLQSTFDAIGLSFCYSYVPEAITWTIVGYVDETTRIVRLGAKSDVVQYMTELVIVKIGNYTELLPNEAFGFSFSGPNYGPYQGYASPGIPDAEINLNIKANIGHFRWTIQVGNVTAPCPAAWCGEFTTGFPNPLAPAWPKQVTDVQCEWFPNAGIPGCAPK